MNAVASVTQASCFCRGPNKHFFAFESFPRDVLVVVAGPRRSGVTSTSLALSGALHRHQRVLLVTEFDDPAVWLGHRGIVVFDGGQSYGAATSNFRGRRVRVSMGPHHPDIEVQFDEEIVMEGEVDIASLVGLLNVF